MSAYRVLKRDVLVNGVLNEVGSVDAVDADKAIATASGGEPGTYVAIPERSWTEIAGAPDETDRPLIWSRVAA